jgi:mycofactocin precursor
MPTRPIPSSTEPVPNVSADTTTLGSEAAPVASPALVADDLLVEDVSIDGMCGVY